MNRKQWFVFSGVFFLLVIFFTANATMPIIPTASESVYLAQIIRKDLYGLFVNIFIGLALICFMSGLLEKEGK